jgi:c-di-GMP-binding flagellar brake protein YcgR
VRQFERHELENAATLRLHVDPEHQLQFSTNADAAQGVPADLADLSAGGMGLRTKHFLPRGCTIKVSIETSRGLIFNTRVRVQRVRMTDRDPTYMLGTKFDAEHKPTAEQMEALLADNRATSPTGDAK